MSGFLGLKGGDENLIRGRHNIADALGVHVNTLDAWRKRAKKNGDPMPIFCPGGGGLEADRNDLMSWRKRQI